ncbi:MAG TPA: glycosyltransferase family 1 protein [Acidimicrobiales bacterium]|jgi:glycosyltransferase involved in cell wall biosynthesis|nr:glycosyltransferase family 1 protein [Acidimicrobiales bacterium]
MQVTIDDQAFTLQRRGGISRYFTELLRVFRTDPDFGVEPLTPFRFVVNEHLLELDPDRYRRARLPPIGQRNRVLRPLNRVAVRRRPEHQRLVHHTYYLPDALQVPAGARLCTIYDMTPELFPELFPYGNPHQAKRAYVKACDAVLCISQTTKHDLLATYGHLDKPVVVTPLGVSEAFFSPPPSDPASSGYILYVGQRVSYKNFDVLLRAFQRIAADHPAISLVCAGPPFDAAELSRLEGLHLADRVVHRTVGDGDMPALFAGAVCLVFPSRYEGFGLPVIEAYAAGCPVILADTPCSVEVGSTAAQFFPPDDDERLAGLVDQLAGDPTRRNEWIDAGRLRARDFTWRRTAELTRQVYRELGAE